jgi:hypothetical protein
VGAGRGYRGDMSLSPFPLKSTDDTVPTTRLHEMRRHQVYRLERPRRRPLLARLRRSLRGRFAR